MIYVRMIEDRNGNLTDVEYYCSGICAPADADGWPGGSETDYDVYCADCGDLLWEGLESTYADGG